MFGWLASANNGAMVSAQDNADGVWFLGPYGATQYVHTCTLAMQGDPEALEQWDRILMRDVCRGRGTWKLARWIIARNARHTGAGDAADMLQDSILLAQGYTSTRLTDVIAMAEWLDLSNALDAEAEAEAWGTRIPLEWLE